jgi:hypothetical protein
VGTNGPDLAPSDLHLFLHLKNFLGDKQFDDDADLKDAVQKWLTSQAAAFYEGIQNLCPAMISASIMVANMWKNSLKNVESDNNKILYETLLDFFLYCNGTYFLNKPHNLCMFCIHIRLHIAFHSLHLLQVSHRNVSCFLL